LKQFLKRVEKNSKEKGWDKEIEKFSRQLEKLFPPAPLQNPFSIYFKQVDKDELKRVSELYTLL